MHDVGMPGTGFDGRLTCEDGVGGDRYVSWWWAAGWAAENAVFSEAADELADCTLAVIIVNVAVVVVLMVVVLCGYSNLVFWQQQPVGLACLCRQVEHA